MDLLIQDIDLPKEGDFIVIRSDGKAYYVSSNPKNAYEREVVPVPLHGRLIDADALEQDAQKRLLICNKYDDQFQKPYEVMRAIALAPTIIPASKGNEGEEHTMDEFMYGQEGNPNDGSM